MQLIRFKVIRASRLLMGAVIALLVIVLAVMILRIALDSGGAPVSTHSEDTSIVRDDGENKAVAAFAAASSLDEAMFQEPRVENEHEDLSVDQGILIEKIPLDTPTPQPDRAAAAEATPAPTRGLKRRVLIYHTHTHEAYEQDPADPYEALEPWRTEDQSHSVVRVGEELAVLLRARGIEVVHDLTDHEPPKLATAYVRSLVTLEKYADQAFDCYIDLHRDAAIDSEQHAKVVLSGASKPCAQLMMLIGKGEDFDVKPYYTENLSFARQLTLAINQVQSGLCKDVLVKQNRYNQHIGKRAILVEVGNNKNTLREALNAMPALAEALDAVLDGEVFLEPQATHVALPASAGG